MTERNLFEEAARKKLRIPSDRGELTVEQLWDLPLTSDRTLSLDAVAQSVHVQLKATSETSFVKTKPNPRQAALQLQLDIIVYIIAVKQAEAETQAKANETRALRERLEAALISKQEKALEDMSEDDIKKQLEALASSEKS
jgi:hypothetical protein